MDEVRLSGGVITYVADGRADRIGRLVITSCEAFDNYPPGLPGRNLATLARLPGGLEFAFTLLRLKRARRLPMTWGWMSRLPVPDAVMDGWFRPLWASREIRRDLRTYVLGVPDRAELLRWAEELRTFDRPALVIWATEDRVMPLDHGRRLAALLPQGRLRSVKRCPGVKISCGPA